MNIKLIIVLSIFCFLEKDKTYSQNIKISYHLGYACNTEINGKAVSGSCMTNERMEYTPKKGKKHIESNKFEFNRDIRQYENGGFGKNLVEDSLKIFHLSKKITSKEFNRLLNYLKLVESEFDEKTGATVYLQKKIISKWDKIHLNSIKGKFKESKKKLKKNLGI